MRDTARYSIFAIGLAGVIAVVIARDPIARNVHLAGLLVAGIANTVALFRLRSPGAHNPVHVSIGLAIANTVGLASAFYFWGVFSAVLVVIPVGCLLFARERSSKLGLGMVAGVVAMHLTLTILIATDVFTDRSFTQITALPTATKVACIAVFDGILLLGLIAARHVHRSSQAVTDSLDSALRALAQRDALIAEAIAERDDALQLDMPGRYSGHVIGRYRLGNIIGHGAMGAIYDSVDIETGGAAAVKLMHSHQLADPAQFRCFVLEARVTSGLNHPHIVRVLSATYRLEDDSFPYIAMERLWGQSLRALLLDRPMLPLREVITMVKQIGSALDAARDAGVVHRDVQPSNLFRCEDGRWKLLDFGTCIEPASERGESTFTGTLIGTPEYMAPEQARGESLDIRADIYGLAASSYRALLGQPPFSGANLHDLLRRIGHERAIPPTELRDVPAHVDGVFDSALAKQRARRHASAGEFAAALEIALTGEISDTSLDAQCEYGSRRNGATETVPSEPISITMLPLRSVR